ncbi:MAG: hypothetical protein AAGK21_15525 [Bacteroidota bacterium]
MPVTPFHLGPGLLAKGLAPTSVSLTAFTLANVVIDAESIVNLVAGRFPIHAELHTLLGALVAGLASGGAVALAGRRWKRPTWAWRPALTGGVLGGLGQTLLDAVMHADLQPLLPFTEVNPVLRAVDLGTLHLACVVVGIMGGILWAWRH